MAQDFGVLTPVGGGDPIPLLSKKLRVGRREGCDIVLRFPNVSSHHCLLEMTEGFWFVRDLKSRNGIKVNGVRVPIGLRKRVDPDNIISFANVPTWWQTLVDALIIVVALAGPGFVRLVRGRKVQ